MTGQRLRLAMAAAIGAALLAASAPAHAEREVCRDGLCAWVMECRADREKILLKPDDSGFTRTRPGGRGIPDRITHYNIDANCLDEQEEFVGYVWLRRGCNFSVQPCERGEETIVARLPSICGDWVFFNQLSCPFDVSTPTPPPPPPPDPCPPARLGTEGCPYPSLGGKTQAEFVAFCQDYAGRAVAAVSEIQQLGCAAEGPRWSADAGAHASWCIGLNGDRGPPNAETAARAGALARCRKQIGIAVQPPQGDAGVLAVRRDFTGEWDTLAGGAGYRMVLRQSGGQVTGTYQPGNGTIASTGIAQGADGRLHITFVWTEGSGAGGAGRFTLAADGMSFAGSWSSTADPNVAAAAWTGTRAAAGSAPAADAVSPPGVKLLPKKKLLDPNLIGQ
jgi:hypothetical protein